MFSVGFGINSEMGDGSDLPAEARFLGKHSASGAAMVPRE